LLSSRYTTLSGNFPIENVNKRIFQVSRRREFSCVTNKALSFSCSIMVHRMSVSILFGAVRMFLFC
jgi:hypothetical protein